MAAEADGTYRTEAALLEVLILECVRQSDGGQLTSICACRSNIKHVS